ncbi:MarR family winged helix-turn-helix transcriptional regulator [Lentzea flaviverrucosa]|uniref:DNA-binding transcriptional regulator, MarR family n=1 Tax=Lentzea flaviverrucosa TaxID=200379 RepID=A0A1H9GWY2_9PSEU|nr:MarR family winged helix-turn-helix transcriptional regulator [Lentzea flaviverrucosa]RDI34774.1 MarR family transcriptional regulator [Lentzea flaviverrucosa]SEQ54544.1 DNA-binding transcriptional regulator, MarR family [Lentzea flaviverrucosa]
MTPDAKGPRWLTAEQRLAWLDMVRVLTRLPATLDAQLERDAGLSFFEYHVLSMLSEVPGHTLRLSRLAQLTSSSLSRLSNVVKRLEGRGLLCREPDPDDGRASRAVLTAAGTAAVERAAPGHVTAVRELVVDPLDATQLSQLHAAHERILGRLDPASSSRPEWLET